MKARALGVALIFMAVASCGVEAADAVPEAASAPAPAEPASAASAASAPMAVPQITPTVAPPKPAAPAAASSSDDDERLQITEAYIELRTGPGRGYPIFFVAARNEWIRIELRHTDWYRVRTDGGKVGWVDRHQLETTLTAAGARKSFRDVMIDDFLSRHVQLGAAWGDFKSEPMLKVWASARVSETLSVEATYGQVQGVFSGTDFWHLNVVAEPWADRRISPFIGIGLGKFENFPNLSLVSATTTNAKLANVGIGVRYYLSDRFVLRVDYSLYTVFVNDAKYSEYRAFTGGLSFFF